MSPDFSELPISPALRWTVVILGFVRDVVAAVAWPTAVVLVAWIFRQPIGELLRRIKSLEAAGVKVDAGLLAQLPPTNEAVRIKNPVSPVTVPERAAPRTES